VTDYCYGNDARNLGEYGWFWENASGRTHEVGTRRANGWGLYDIHGNVWQWCADWYAGYSDGHQIDPKGADSGEYRVLRGGSWAFGVDLCRAAYRYKYSPLIRIDFNGFRVCFGVD
jgi:formylglycine-generating enzyme required for sulfatase activity